MRELGKRFYVACAGGIAVTLLMVACGQDWMGMVCPEPPTIKTTILTWEITPDPKVRCAELGANTLVRDGACITCSFSSETSVCTVYTTKPSQVEDRIIGHEVKHAFGCRHA
jgi:3-deoxy-D-manno-octulosonate 8-phosphate phosphatase KdsC-like HAD superfamily phosphatase